MEKAEKYHHSFNYQSRADRLKTQKQNKKLEDDQNKRELQKKGLSSEDYWKTMVKTREDVVKFYQLYHPEYPEELAMAISFRLEKLLFKTMSGEQLDDVEMKYFKKQQESNHWDPFKEIEDQKLEGKIRLTQKRLEELMNE